MRASDPPSRSATQTASPCTAGHIAVEHHHVVAVYAALLQRRRPVVREVGGEPAIAQPLRDVAGELDVILDHQHAHMDIVLHDGSQHHHTRVLHPCDRPPDTNCAMFAQRLPIVVAALGAATAIAACGSHSTHPSGAARPTSQARVRQDMVSFSRCMRSHGAPDFPDPDSPQRFKAALDPSSSHAPAFQSAETACRHLLPASRAPRGAQRRRACG